jgi:hypothetical protein
MKNQNKAGKAGEFTSVSDGHFPEHNMYEENVYDTKY